MTTNHIIRFIDQYQMGSNPNEFEVGWSYEGLPTANDKAQALQELLDTVGTAAEDWHLAPLIRTEEAGTSLANFGRGPIVVHQDGWCVYGIATKPPKYGQLIEGTRMPLYKDVVKA